MDEEQVYAVQLHTGEALVQALGQQARHLAGVRAAQPALGGHAHSLRKPTLKGLSNHQLRLAVAVPGRNVQEVDAGLHRLYHRGH